LGLLRRMRRSGAWPGKVWLDDVEVAGDSCAVSVNGEIGDSLTAYYNEHDPFAEPGSYAKSQVRTELASC